MRQRTALSWLRAAALLAMTAFTLACWWAVAMLAAYCLEPR